MIKFFTFLTHFVCQIDCLLTISFRWHFTNRLVLKNL